MNNTLSMEFSLERKPSIWEFKSQYITVPESAYRDIKEPIYDLPSNNTHIAIVYDRYEWFMTYYDILRDMAREEYIEKYYFDQYRRWKLDNGKRI